MRYMPRSPCRPRLPRTTASSRLAGCRSSAIAGVIGSHELMEFTVIGQTVNLASRIERLTRVHDVGVLVSAAARERLDPRFALQAMPAREVRGVSEPVPTFAVMGFREGG